MAEPRVHIGSVSSVNAARREVRIEPVRGYEGLYRDMKWVRLAPSAETELKCKIADVRAHGKTVIVRLGPGLPRDTVAQLKNAAVLALPQELKTRPTVLTAEELLGMTIVEEKGAVLGVITQAYAARANDMIEVTRTDGTTFMLPLIEKLVARINWELGEVAVCDITPYTVTNED